MALPDSSPSVSHQSGYRVSLLGLFVLILGIGTALGAARLSRWNVLVGVCVAIATWLVFGLLFQARDLWRFRQCQLPQDPAIRVAIHWAIAWRIAAALAMTGYVAFRYCQFALPLPIGGREFWDPDVARLLPDAVLAVTLLATLRPVARNQHTSSSLRRRCLTGVAFLAGVALCVVMAIDKMLLPYFVHVAIRGVEAVQPYRRMGAEFYRPGIESRLHEEWIRGGVMSLLLLLVSALLTYRLAKVWGRGARARTVVGVMLASALAILAYEVIWAGWIALPRLSPFLFQSLHVRHPLLAGAAVAAIAVFSSAAAWRLSAIESSGKEEEMVWRPTGRRYYHEFVALFWLPFLVIVIDLVRTAWQVPMSRWAGSVGSLVIDVASALAADLLALLWLSLFLAAMGRGLAWLFRGTSPWPGEITPLSAGNLVALWLAISCLMLLAAPSLAWMGSAFWLAPTLGQP